MRICIMCGNEFEGKESEYTCEKCQEKMKLLKKLEMVENARKKVERKTGILKSEKSKYNFSNPYEKVKERVCNNIDSFSSIPEAMVAIQMERIGLEYETQKEIAGKKVDFYIPEIKIILEIDGELYNTDRDKSFLRDREIMRVVGEQWEILHINAKAVPKYTWDLRNALPYVVSMRNDMNMFRNSLCDTDFLEEFRTFEWFMKKGTLYNEYPKLFKPN